MSVNSDPLRTLWDALAAHGCQPHGQLHDFYARCPAHKGESVRALHVSVGGDGRALLRCFPHQCEIKQIVAAINLSIADLFPPGSHRARRRHLHEARRPDFTGNARTLVNVLLALEETGADWFVELRVDCPHCGSPRALLCASPRRVFLSCPGDECADELGYGACTLEQFQQALAAQIEDRREAA